MNRNSPDDLDTAAPVPAADEDVVMGFKRITPANFTCADLSRAFGLADANEWIAWFNEIRVGDHAGSASLVQSTYNCRSPKTWR